jgi:hypothetical protein
VTLRFLTGCCGLLLLWSAGCNATSGAQPTTSSTSTAAVKSTTPIHATGSTAASVETPSDEPVIYECSRDESFDSLSSFEAGANTGITDLSVLREAREKAKTDSAMLRDKLDEVLSFEPLVKPRIIVASPK